MGCKKNRNIFKVIKKTPVFYEDTINFFRKNGWEVECYRVWYIGLANSFGINNQP